ncbi:type II restriction endonuclease [Parasphingorhabdus sp.]|uniref:type II restriction endonuclease n=1 Tax=Parasphingorhabdus sp. TaxID=2709688 RepID=UPI003A91BC81
MKRGYLSEHFLGIALKRLSQVETMPQTSNQHEFNGSAELRRLLGDADRKNIPTRFIWINGEQEAIPVDGTVSWYDARRNHPTRTEYRLYYASNDVTDLMQPDDTFFLAIRSSGDAMVIITPSGSTMYNQLLWLFGLDDQQSLQFSYQPVEGDHDAQLDFAARYILEALEIDPEEPEGDMLDRLIEPFGLEFPTTKVISELARSSLPEISAKDSPDIAVLEWIDREIQLFSRLERHIVGDRIKSGFTDHGGADVEGFIKFSLTVQNRRKSRAGHALENHLDAAFKEFGLKYQRGALTENRNRPDFLFPGQVEYHDPEFPSSQLLMLGAKSTLKDRWRQVLSEAERIDQKHLLTLEPGISENQTDEMQAKSLRLVVPKKLHATYKQSQQEWLMDLSEFIAEVQKRALI